MKKLIQSIENFQSDIPQEIADKEAILRFMKGNPDCLLRSNTIAHFSASAWVLNQSHDKALMIYHNLYNSFAWTGGHADGNANLKELALQELYEETGIKNAKFMSEDIFSLEILTVDGHIKNGAYVPSHLHLNVTYLLEADENQVLAIKADENSAVAWIALEDLKLKVSEPWMYANIYQKLLNKLQAK